MKETIIIKSDIYFFKFGQNRTEHKMHNHCIGQNNLSKIDHSSGNFNEWFFMSIILA